MEGKAKSLEDNWLSLPQPVGVIPIDTITWCCEIEVEVIMMIRGRLGQQSLCFRPKIKFWWLMQ